MTNTHELSPLTKAEMHEVPNLIRAFELEKWLSWHSHIEDAAAAIFIGEGSSLQFPAHNFNYQAKLSHIRGNPVTEDFRSVDIFAKGGREAQGDYGDSFCSYPLFLISNSGETAELVDFMRDRLLHADVEERTEFERMHVLTSKENSSLEHALIDSTNGHDLGDFQPRNNVKILQCGSESAVPATKSVVEQALAFATYMIDPAQYAFYRNTFAENFEQTLTSDLPPRVLEALCASSHIVFAGGNNGVGAELALKFSETRTATSFYYPNTDILHGHAAALPEDSCVVLIEPDLRDRRKLHDDLVGAFNLNVLELDPPDRSNSAGVAFAGIKTSCHTDIRNLRLAGFIQLAAGWNMLTKVADHKGIDLDRPDGVRKVGNPWKLPSV